MRQTERRPEAERREEKQQRFKGRKEEKLGKHFYVELCEKIFYLFKGKKEGESMSELMLFLFLFFFYIWRVKLEIPASCSEKSSGLIFEV